MDSQAQNPDDGAAIALLHHPSRRKAWLGKVSEVHGRTPGINKLPLKVLGTIGSLVVVNVVVWVGVGVVLVSFHLLVFCVWRELFVCLLAWMLMRGVGVSSVSKISRRNIGGGQGEGRWRSEGREREVRLSCDNAFLEGLEMWRKNMFGLR